MNELQEWVKNTIKKGEKLLRKNDLISFYELATKQMYADSYGSGLYIGAVTKFLMENGINPYDYFKDEIPSIFMIELSDKLKSLHRNSLLCADLEEIGVDNWDNLDQKVQQSIQEQAKKVRARLVI